MEITEVRVKLLTGRSDRLRAFCSMTIDDDFVVHDLRVIEGEKGKFVAMPSRKLSDSCPQCGGKNHLRAQYCNDCGAELDGDRAEGRKLHVDVAHPINTPCREHIQDAVLEAYEKDVSRKEEGEEPKHIFLEDDLAALSGEKEKETGPAVSEPPAEELGTEEQHGGEPEEQPEDEEEGAVEVPPEPEGTTTEEQAAPETDQSSPWPADENWVGPTEGETEQEEGEKVQQEIEEEQEEN